MLQDEDHSYWVFAKTESHWTGNVGTQYSRWYQNAGLVLWRPRPVSEQQQWQLWPCSS